MARPRKTGMEYFPHDCDASTDDKIEALRSLYGNDGYAFYFILLERIFRTENAELDISSSSFKLALIKRVGVDQQRFEEILATALDVGAFDRMVFVEKGVLTSKGIKRRFENIQNLRASWRNKKNNGVFSGENHKKSIVFSRENLEKMPQSKVKQNKEKVEYVVPLGEKVKDWT